MIRTIMTAAACLSLAACSGGESESDELAQAKLEAAEAKLEAAEAKLAASEGDTKAAAAPAAAAPAAAAPAAATPAAAASKAPATPKTKSARCRVSTKMNDYTGQCQFTSRGGGSFKVARADGDQFADDITEVIVDVTGTNRANLSLRQNGSVYEAGSLTRSSSDRACWEDEFFAVCAY